MVSRRSAAVRRRKLGVCVTVCVCVCVCVGMCDQAERSGRRGWRQTNADQLIAAVRLDSDTVDGSGRTLASSGGAGGGDAALGSGAFRDGWHVPLPRRSGGPGGEGADGGSGALVTVRPRTTRVPSHMTNTHTHTHALTHTHTHTYTYTRAHTRAYVGAMAVNTFSYFQFPNPRPTCRLSCGLVRQWLIG